MKYKSTNEGLTCGMRGQVLLTSPNWFGEGKKEKRRGKERNEGIFRVRSSHFSLHFPVIGSANSSEARSKVGPHCKGYAWVPVLWSFDKFREIGVFSYLFYSLTKSHVNGLDGARP